MLHCLPHALTLQPLPSSILANDPWHCHQHGGREHGVALHAHLRGRKTRASAQRGGFAHLNQCGRGVVRVHPRWYAGRPHRAQSRDGRQPCHDWRGVFLPRASRNLFAVRTADGLGRSLEPALSSGRGCHAGRHNPIRTAHRRVRHQPHRKQCRVWDRSSHRWVSCIHIL